MLQENSLPSSASASVTNLLIAGLPQGEKNRFREGCDPVDLAYGEILCQPERELGHVYFPGTSFISLVTTCRSHKSLEMGMIGSEGMLGATLALEVSSAPLRGVVQGSGTALRMGAEQFRRLLSDTPALRRTINRYLYVSMSQLSHAALCARFHNIDSRLALWLLMTHDRSHSDSFHITHEGLANMLGVRRSSITVAAATLQKNGIISYARGDISILNRKELEKTACGCYGEIVDDYARILR